MSCEPGCLTCERLRDAALEIVGEEGIEALSQERLAEQVGVSACEVSEHYRTAPTACTTPMTRSSATCCAT